jgi:hypothetical protein
VLEGDPKHDEDATPLVRLFGRVVTAAEQPFFLGADKGSNNTGELSAVVEALLWVNDVRAPVNHPSTYARVSKCSHRLSVQRRVLTPCAGPSSSTARAGQW